MNKERVESALADLNNALRQQLVDTKIITPDDWNEKIAPKLSAVSMAIDGVTITARTYRLTNYFD